MGVKGTRDRVICAVVEKEAREWFTQRRKKMWEMERGWTWSGDRQEMMIGIGRMCMAAGRGHSRASGGGGLSAPQLRGSHSHLLLSTTPFSLLSKSVVALTLLSIVPPFYPPRISLFIVFHHPPTLFFFSLSATP